MQSCPALQKHVIAAIVQRKISVIKDETFLKTTALKSSSSLAALLSASCGTHVEGRDAKRGWGHLTSQFWESSNAAVPWSSSRTSGAASAPDVRDRSRSPR